MRRVPGWQAPWLFSPLCRAGGGAQQRTPRDHPAAARDDRRLRAASRRAAHYGIVAGILFGASACLVKPTVETLDADGVLAVLDDWELYAMAIAGITAFVLQQVSLSSGLLATSVATVSTANPIVSVVIGTLLFEERLSRPMWHVVAAVAGLVLAMIGAIVISIAREGGPETADPMTSEAAIPVIV